MKHFTAFFAICGGHENDHFVLTELPVFEALLDDISDNVEILPQAEFGQVHPINMVWSVR